MSVILVPGFKSMYLRARSQPSRFTRSGWSLGSGTTPSIEVTISGDVPHVTIGRMSSAFISTTTSKWASASLTRVFQ